MFFIPGPVIAALTFPGVIIHEAGHLFFCRLFKLQEFDVCFFRFGNPAGYVIHQQTEDFKAQFFVSMGPFFANTLLCVLFCTAAFLPVWELKVFDPLAYFFYWLVLSIGMHAFHFGAGGHGAVLLHHGAHLEVLLEDGVDVLDGGAAALGDALAAFAVDDVVVAALLVGHGIDDGFDARELALVDFRILGKILERTQLGEHVDDFFERAHLANLLELIAEIFQREFFFSKLAFKIGGGFFIDGLFHAFDERHEVAHAEYAGYDAVRIKTFKGVVFFAEADEFYGRAGDFADA